MRLASRHAASRWPGFTAQARARGVGATFAVPLRARERVLGALNVFAVDWLPEGAPQREGAEDGALGLAQALADAAAAGLYNQRAYAEYRTLSGQLQSALSSRIRIEQAKGMLAERWQTDLDVAFGRLRRYARRERLMMDAVARMVIQGGLDDAVLRGKEPKEPRRP
ncbi:ANTAR domain-containing protein [Streptomyces sp. PmtG]